MIVPLHSSLGDRARLYLKKKLLKKLKFCFRKYSLNTKKKKDSRSGIKTKDIYHRILLIQKKD